MPTKTDKSANSGSEQLGKSEEEQPKKLKPCCACPETKKTALEILKSRYVWGGISKDEYWRMKKELQS